MDIFQHLAKSFNFDALIPPGGHDHAIVNPGSPVGEKFANLEHEPIKFCQLAPIQGESFRVTIAFF
ncbi:MAG: hypothetical protein M0Q95_00205 [Porticoccaceae bacterium]|nr:hypothetical protein [Porticoccaceae bacterium]